jgi:hypothetical protein
VPPTLKKRASNEKRCRVRSTTSTAIANATSPAATATASGAVDNHHHSPSSSQNTPAPAATTPSGNYSSSWQLTQSRQGNSFFDNWQFWNLPDPTNGMYYL